MIYSDSNAITIDGFTYSKDMATVLMVDKSIATLDKMQRGVRYIGKWAFTGCDCCNKVYKIESKNAHFFQNIWRLLRKGLSLQ